MIDRRNTLLIPIAVSIALIVPLFSIPRPTNVSSISWKTELLISAVLLVLLVLIKFAKDHSPQETNAMPVVIATAAIGVWSGFSMFWAASWTSALHHSLVSMNYAVVLFLTIKLIRGNDGLGMVLKTLACISLIIGALAFFDFLTMVDFASQEGTLRIRYGKYGEMLATIAPLLIAAAVYARTWKRFLFLMLPGCVAWAVVMLSLSKGAFLSGIVALVLFFCSAILSHRIFRRNLAAAFVTLLTVTLVFQFGISAVSELPSTTQYVTGANDPSRSTSNMRVFTWKVAMEMAHQHPSIGVGADNFGIAFNDARRAYADSNPGDITTSIGEDYIFERAHNEPLQIVAELGVVGLLLFAGFVVSAIWFLFAPTFRSRRKPSPIFLGAVAGCLAFAVSSMFSSFSFRAYQNGIVFFIVLGTAFAMVRIGKKPSKLESKDISTLGNSISSYERIAAIVIVGTLLLFSLFKTAGHFTAYSAERAGSVEESGKLLNASLLLDPDLHGAELALARQAERRDDWTSAAEHYRRAINGGLGVSLIYSYYADAHEKDGELSKAEAALTEGLSIFPRSVFLRSRLATLLEKGGKVEEADQQMEMARSVDLPQANSWYVVLKDGILVAHTHSRTDKAFAPPAELLPANAILVYAGGFDQIPSATP